jgi:hypothetical protein
MSVKAIDRSQAVNAANGKIANRYFLCSVTGRAARGLQVSGRLSSQAITQALQLVGQGEVMRPGGHKTQTSIGSLITGAI